MNDERMCVAVSGAYLFAVQAPVDHKTARISAVSQAGKGCAWKGRQPDRVTFFFDRFRFKNLYSRRARPSPSPSPALLAVRYVDRQTDGDTQTRTLLI